MAVKASHFHSLQAELGEGPIWDQRRGVLWCVDILAPAVHAVDPFSGKRNTWPAPQKIGWILPDDSGRLLAGLADGVYNFEPERGSFSPVVLVEAHLPSNRLNDATLGPDGAVWFGTMDDEEALPTGRFYHFKSELRDCGLAPVCITNGPAVSLDGQKLFTVDTLGREIWVHAVSTDGGKLSNPKLFAQVAEGDGWPDGICCDREGGLWLGLWGGWRARRYDAAGQVTAEVEFPVANVTKIALGGPDGSWAYATTARKGLDEQALAAQPLAGDLFSFALDEV